MKPFVALICVCLCSQAAPAAWHEARTRHFVIDADASATDIRQYAARLERFDATVRLLIGRPDPEPNANQQLRVFVLQSQSAVGKLIGLSTAAGVYIPRVSGATAIVPGRGRYDDEPEALSSQAVFFHEYLHHLMLQDMTVAYPLWVQEGFAELFATARIAKDGSVTVGAVPPYRLYSLRSTAFPIEAMLANKFGKMSDEEVDRLYASAWLLSHYLTFEETRSGQLRAYLNGIGSGVPPLEAARSAFGDLKKLASELDDYRVKSRLSAIRIGGRAIPEAQVAVRPMTAGEAAMMPVTIRSARGVDSTTAAKVAADARATATTYPDDPAVLSALAEAEFDARDFAAAAVAADRALKMRPNDVHAMTYRGMATAAMAKAIPANADWAGARSSFVQANKLAGENAWPLMLYYKSFVDAREAPTPEAIGRLRRAFQLYPADTEVRLLLAREMIRASDFPDARRVLEPALFNPHGSIGRDKANQLLALLDSGKGAEASAALVALAAPASPDSKKKK